VFSIQFERVGHSANSLKSKYAHAVQEPANEADGQGTTAETHKVDTVAGSILLDDKAIRVSNVFERSIAER
jgi:hypothetical protein